MAPSETTDTDRSWTRRTWLGALSATGLAATAGCAGILDQTVSASRVGLSDSAQDDLGVEQSVDTSRNVTVSKSLGPLEGSVTAESALTVYSRGETREAPTEAERWGTSDAALAAWSGGKPVLGVDAASAVGDRDLSSTGDGPIESVPAGATTLFYPEGADEGGLDPGDSLAMVPGEDISWLGGREANGTVSLSEPAHSFDRGAVLPAGAVYPLEQA